MGFRSGDWPGPDQVFIHTLIDLAGWFGALSFWKIQSSELGNIVRQQVSFQGNRVRCLIHASFAKIILPNCSLKWKQFTAHCIPLPVKSELNTKLFFSFLLTWSGVTFHQLLALFLPSSWYYFKRRVMAAAMVFILLIKQDLAQVVTSSVSY